MLVSLRKVAGTWIMAIFSFLLIVSFGIFGIGDIFRGRVSDAVATVDDIEIPRRDVEREFRREVARLQALFGPEFDADQAREMGLVERALDSVITRALYDLEARRLGLAAPDASVVGEIRSMSAFQDQTGVFDANLFRSALANQGLSEDEFVLMLRGDLVRAQLTDAIVGLATAPDVLVHPLFRYANERRSAAYFVITPEAVGEVVEPDEATLRAYYDEHGDRFTAPEYRRLRYLYATPDHLAAEISVSEEEIAAEYAERTAEFTTPERRRLEQILVSDEETAKRVAERLRAGAAFDAVAAELSGQSADALALGTFSRDELATVIGEAADAVFALPEGGISDPVASPLGWHVFRIAAIEPGSVESLEQVRETLARDIARRHAIDALYQLANRLDDTLAGGASLSEAADQLGLSLETVEAVDANGRAPDGGEVALPKTGNFLETAFATPEGETSLLVEGEDASFFIVEVVGVTPATVRPFEEVRDQVRAAWLAEERARRALALAEAAAERLRGGESIEALADEIGVPLLTSGAIRRDGDGAGPAFAPTMVERLFALGPGEVAAGESGEGAIVLRLEQVFDADPQSAPDEVARLRESVRNALAGDLLAAYRAGLEQRYPVSVDRGALDALF